MEVIRSVLGGVSSSSSTTSAAETIECLVHRLSDSTLLDDRRNACRALKAMSRKYRVEVGVQSLDVLANILVHDRSDDEIASYALDTLANILNPTEFPEEEHEENRKNENMGENFTEIFLKDPSHTQSVLDLLADYAFRVRRAALQVLTNLLNNKLKETQNIILGSEMGVSRLMDILVDQREILRNDALLLLIQLTQGNANLQKIIAFENAFDKLSDIIAIEGYSDGGIVVEDALRLTLNLLQYNPSNQTFFREGSYINKIVSFFDLPCLTSNEDIGWSAQKVSNMLNMLSVIRTLVSPSNPTSVTVNCQKSIQSCGLFSQLTKVLMASGIPADVLTETIHTISEIIRGNLTNQEVYAKVTAPSNPPRPAIILLLMSLVNEKQPFSLRCAVLYCFQCYLHNNPMGQHSVLQTLMPATAVNDVSSGQLLCGGLFSKDSLANWFSSVALAHALMDQSDLKIELLRVQLSSTNSDTSDDKPVLLMIHCVNILVNSSHSQTKMGILILLTTWVSSCPIAVNQLLEITSTISYLTGQICSSEHDETFRVLQGVCAFLLGICLLSNGKENNHLLQLVEKRIGVELFLDKLNEVHKHEGFNRALAQPQLRCFNSKDLMFDYHWARTFQFIEHSISVFLNESSLTTVPTESETDPAVLKQYKELIREQDQKIKEISNANLYLQKELATAKQSIDEFTVAVQSLQDQNVILKQQQISTSITIPNRNEKEMDYLTDQLNALRLALGEKEIEVERLSAELKAKDTTLKKTLELYKTIQEEQEDLLLMLADQDAQLQEANARLLEFCLESKEKNRDSVE